MFHCQRIILAAAVLIAVGLYAAQVAAAPENNDDEKACRDKSGEIRIAACTRAIASGRFRSGDLAQLYNIRANAYLYRFGDDYISILDNKKDFDRAIADYNTAIRLAPTYLEAFENRNILYTTRGGAFFKRRDFDRAIADYSAAIQGPPNCSAGYCIARISSLSSRGDAFYLTGKYDRAITDYSAALKIDPKLPWALYGRGMAKLKKGDTASGNANIAAAKVLQADIAERFARFGVK